MTLVSGVANTVGNVAGTQVLKNSKNFKLNQDKLLFMGAAGVLGVTAGEALVEKALPPSISDVDIPEVYMGHSEEETQEAYTKYSELTDEEKAEIQKAYENAIKEFKEVKVCESVIMCVNFEGITFEEFLEEHPEYKEAVSIMGPIAADYNDKMQQAVEDYQHNTPWYEKLGSLFGMKNGRDEAIKKAQEEYVKEHPDCESIIDFATELNKSNIDKLKELFR